MKYKIIIDHNKYGYVEDIHISEVIFEIEPPEYPTPKRIVFEAIDKGEMTHEHWYNVTGVYQEIDGKWVRYEMDEREKGVHRTHCCVFHGCKYGDFDCPVSNRSLKQEHPCEDCNAGERHTLFGKGDSVDKEHTHYD